MVSDTLSREAGSKISQNQTSCRNKLIISHCFCCPVTSLKLYTLRRKSRNHKALRIVMVHKYNFRFQGAKLWKWVKICSLKHYVDALASSLHINYFFTLLSQIFTQSWWHVISRCKFQISCDQLTKLYQTCA